MNRQGRQLFFGIQGQPPMLLQNQNAAQFLIRCFSAEEPETEKEYPVMTSEEFSERFQKHPLGWVFQSMETADNETQLERYLSMAHGMVLLLEFQDELSKDEAGFLNEAARGNAKRNYDRVTKTNFEPPKTKQ